MTETPYPLHGRCTCGAVHYEMRRPPMFVHCCHCTWCQREAGSAFVINALVESEQVAILEGEVEEVTTPSNSGTGQIIVRCPQCNVALWSHYSAAREAIAFVRVGTLDDASACPPDIHIFTSSKLSWVTLDDSIPCVDAYYRRSAYWPEDSVARYKAALQG